MKQILLFISIVVLTLSSSHSVATTLSNEKTSLFNRWQVVSQKSISALPTTSSVNSAQHLTTNIEELSQLLLATEVSVVVTLPLPDGTFSDFRLTPSTVVAKALALKYPNIKTFSGYQVADPKNEGRFDITPHGFHGMFQVDNETVFIEPLSMSSTNNYHSYYRKNAQQSSQTRLMQQLAPKSMPVMQQFNSSNRVNKQAKAQSSLKTYRLAISAAGEYTQFHGGSKSDALAAIVTLVNRLHGIFQRDLSINLELVGNNDLIIFTDPATDPFDNTDEDGSINTGVIDGIIGNSNYDIGHIVGTGGGGLAILGGACLDDYKGDGVTGALNPINDSFYIDYVAHEVGHQFGAEHSFNGEEEACGGGNRSSDSAYEPGSGSTIMGYASICGSQNLQNHSDAYFHSHSIDQIEAFISLGAGSGCGVTSSTINNNPVVDAGSDYTIPAQTPFMLMGSATDLDGDDLTYSWEQYDLGTSSQSIAEQIDDGTRPLFRTWAPISEASRYFPRLVDVLVSHTTIGETYPTTDRELNLRLLVRDGRGGVNVDTMMVTVVDTTEAFAVTAPISNDIWSSSQHLVMWNVANTDLPPISCDAVDIYLSIDGGENFTIELANNVSNDGQHEVTLSALSSDESRLKVACSDNIFYAVNDGNFTVVNDSVVELVITGQQSISVNEDDSIELTTTMFTYSDIEATSLTVSSGANYQVNGNVVTPNVGFSGTLSVPVTGHAGQITSDEFITSITVIADITPTVNSGSSSSGGSMGWLLFGVIFLFTRKSRQK